MADEERLAPLYAAIGTSCDAIEGWLAGADGQPPSDGARPSGRHARGAKINSSEELLPPKVENPDKINSMFLFRRLPGTCGLLIACLCVSIAGCHSTLRRGPPTVVFSKVPVADEGGPSSWALVEGHALGARPGQRIVLFAKSEVWWVQPFAYQPYTTIGDTGEWVAKTHLGTEYAALLVDPEYHPASIMTVLPKLGGGVVAIATVKGTPQRSAPAEAVNRSVHFGGYDWNVSGGVKRSIGKLRPYKPQNVSLTPDGFLHLRITKEADGWACSGVALDRSLGYGTYSFVVQDVSHLEPAAAVNMFTWSISGADQNYREMNINLTQWGDPDSKNAEYVMQPYYVPQNVYRFSVGHGPMAYSFHWTPESVSFETRRGILGSKDRKLVSSRVFTSGIPVPGGETAHIQFCVFGYPKVPLAHEAEVVIEKFQYLP
jgi:hypothetical protein